MLRRGLTPGQWRSLSRSEQAEMMAYDSRGQERRERLLGQIQALADEAGPWGLVAQVLILLSE